MSHRADALGIPRQAITAWQRLQEALDDAGTIPCAGPGRDRWQGNAVQQRAAARACISCPVLRACDAYADAAGEEHGVWGGLTVVERNRRRRGSGR